jgi:hypothetical protein
VKVNGLSFHVVSEGEGPAVLLLHGFPDYFHLAQSATGARQSGFPRESPTVFAALASRTSPRPWRLPRYPSFSMT